MRKVGKLEEGHVKWVHVDPKDCYGVAVLKSKETVFFHCNSVATMKIIGGRLKWLKISHDKIFKKRMPKPGDSIFFERFVGGEKGVKASPWTTKVAYLNATNHVKSYINI